MLEDEIIARARFLFIQEPKIPMWDCVKRAVNELLDNGTLWDLSNNFDITKDDFIDSIARHIS